MATSTSMFVEQSQHFPMASSVWLHSNGMNLSTDIHQYQSSSQVYDYRGKHSHTASQPTMPATLPCHITIIDGPFQHSRRQQQKLEAMELSKRLYMDKPMKKSKSLPGLVKGSVFSRQTPVQSVSFLIPTPPNPSATNSRDDLMINNDDLIEGPHETAVGLESSADTRRPRVYFADFKNIQFIEEKRENHETKSSSGSHHRRSRIRPSKRHSILTSETNPISAPPVQQTSAIDSNNNGNHHPHTRLHYIPTGQELTVKKQNLIISSRGTSVHVAHLPDITNISVQRESINNDNSPPKSSSHREKTIRIRKVVIDNPANICLDLSRDHTRSSHGHSSSVRESNQRSQTSTTAEVDTNAVVQRRSSLVSSSSNTNARRYPSLKTIALRPQHPAPFKMDSHNHGSQLSQYPNSLSSHGRHSARAHVSHDPVSTNEPLNHNTRSLMRTESAKQLKRSHVTSFTTKNTPVYMTGNDQNENHRQIHKSQSRKSSEERFQNLLTIVRPPIIANSSNSNMINQEATLPQTHLHNVTPSASSRSVRRASAQGPLVFHISTNTIII